MKASAMQNTILEVQNLKVRFAVKRGPGWGAKTYLHAVDDISFTVNSGETLAIVGESGSGKTTAALAVARLLKTWDSRLLLDGDGYYKFRRRRIAPCTPKDAGYLSRILIQASIRAQRAEAIVREPLDSLSHKSQSEKSDIVTGLFEAVGLRPEQMRLFPHQFSGGQRQRIGIARALATQPKLIICDEPVSALDVAVQAQILNLLRRLQKELGLTYLFISHDLGVVQHMSDSIAVMYMGKIVEQADRISLFSNPLHPYTKALLSAVPSVDKKRCAASKRILIPGDLPDPINRPQGCRFAGRCPVAQSDCYQSEPKLRVLPSSHRISCHLVDDSEKAPF